MTKLNFIKYSFILGIAMFSILSCEKKDDVSALTISSIEASGPSVTDGKNVTVDLNSSTAVKDAPVSLSITISFNKEVDATTVTKTSVLVSAGDNGVDIDALKVVASTVTFNVTLKRGTDYTLKLTNAIKAKDGGNFSETSRTFTTGGVAEVTPPQNDKQKAYWSMDGNADDVLGTYNPKSDGIVNIVYQEDRHGQASSAAYFDGDKSIIEYANGSEMINSDNLTLSFWVKTHSEGHKGGHFVVGLGAFYGIQFEINGSYTFSKFAVSYENESGVTFPEDLALTSNAKDNTNGGWQGWTYAKPIADDQMQAILKDKWLHVIYTFDGTKKTGSLYFNGELMKSFDFNLWPDGDDKKTGNKIKFSGKAPDVLDELALGFIQTRGGTLWDDESWGGYDLPDANHFKGWLDDIRIFHAAYTSDDVKALYNAEKAK